MNKLNLDNKKTALMILFALVLLTMVSLLSIGGFIILQDNFVNVSEGQEDDFLKDEVPIGELAPSIEPSLDPTILTPTSQPTKTVEEVSGEGCEYDGVRYDEGEEFKKDDQECYCSYDSDNNLSVKCKPIIYTPDIDTSDWITYESNDFGIKFKYPPNYDVQVVANGLLGVLLPPDPEFSDRPIGIINISKQYRPSTYGSVNNPEETNPIRMPPIKVNNEEYIFDKFILGEGDDCGGGFMDTFIFTLREDLHISVINLELTEVENCAEDGDVKEFKTSTSDLEIARKIISTIEFI